MAGHIEDAVPLGLRALKLARKHEERGYEAYALRLLGQIYCRLDPPDSENSEQYLWQGMILAEELGMRPLVAHCYLDLGELCTRTNMREEAQEHLNTAMTLYREMDMRFWPEQVRSEKHQLG